MKTVEKVHQNLKNLYINIKFKMKMIKNRLMNKEHSIKINVFSRYYLLL